MATYSTNEFKSGLKIMLDGDPYAIVENEFVKPGKGQAFNRVKVRNLKTGRTIERTFKSGDTAEGADVVDVELQYLYNDGEYWHFMDQQSYEQLTADAAADGRFCQVVERRSDLSGDLVEWHPPERGSTQFRHYDDCGNRPWVARRHFGRRR